VILTKKQISHWESFILPQNRKKLCSFLGIIEIAKYGQSNNIGTNKVCRCSNKTFPLARRHILATCHCNIIYL